MVWSPTRTRSASSRNWCAAWFTRWCGVADVIADPDAAFEIAVEGYVTELAEEQHGTQRQVLENSIALWDGAGGDTTLDKWRATQELLIEMDLLAEPLDDLSACFDMRFLPGVAE